MARLQKFQMTDSVSWMGMTNENHLGLLGAKQPQKAADVMIQLLSRKYGKSLEYYLRQFPKKMYETDDEYYWKLVGSSRQNVPLVEARYQGSVVTADDYNIGAGGTIIELVFEQDWFADGNRIVGEKNEVYPLRVLGPAKLDGSFAIYECELMGGVTNGMPGDELISGKRFSVDYSPIESDLSRQVGDIRFSSPISMRNEWTTIRIHHKVGGKMLKSKLAMGIPFQTRSGEVKIADTWMHNVDFQFEQEFAHEKNLAIMYSRSNRLSNGEYQNVGKSGNVIKEGDGLRAQMEYSNVIYYDKFDLKEINKALLDLCESKLEMGDRMFLLRTGERGAAQFSEAVLDVTSGWNAINYLGGNSNINTINKTSSELHSNSLTAGFQFTEYRYANNIVVKIEVDPFYDDRERNKIEHPNGGVAESYRYDIMYIGTNSMDVPNIQLCGVKGMEEMRGYQNGPFGNPFTGESNMMYASTDEDSATIHKKTTLGVVIYDSNRVMSFIPVQLQ